MKNLLFKTIVPITNNQYAVINGKAISTDFEHYIVVPTDKPDGVYNLLNKQTDDKIDKFCVLPKLNKPKSFTIETKWILETLKQLKLHAGNDDLRPVMSSFCFDLPKGCICSTDACTLRTISNPNLTGDVQILIPAIFDLTKLTYLSKNDKTITVMYDAKNACFKGDNFEMYIRLVEGVYPHYEAVIAKDYADFKYGFMFPAETIKKIENDIKDFKKLGAIGGKKGHMLLRITGNKARFINIDTNIDVEYDIERFDYNSTADVDKHNVTLMSMMVMMPIDDTVEIGIDYMKYRKNIVPFAFKNKVSAMLSIPQIAETAKIVREVKPIEVTPIEVKKVEPEVKPITKTEMKTTKTKPNIQFIDYSEKAVAIVGDTIKIKDLLKELGCRYNKFLSCGAGWITSKRNIEKVKSELEMVFA